MPGCVVGKSLSVISAASIARGKGVCKRCGVAALISRRTKKKKYQWLAWWLMIAIKKKKKKKKKRTASENALTGTEISQLVKFRLVNFRVFGTLPTNWLDASKRIRAFHLANSVAGIGDDAAIHINCVCFTTATGTETFNVAGALAALAAQHPRGYLWLDTSQKDGPDPTRSWNCWIHSLRTPKIIIQRVFLLKSNA